MSLRGVITPARVGVMTQTKLPRHGIRYLLAKPTEPVSPVTDCVACNEGCHCEGGIDGIGCEHYGCWGRDATNDCAIGGATHRAHTIAYRQYVSDRHAYDQQSHLR